MDKKQINIGLFGFGTVGKGLYDVLKKIQPENVNIVKVCVRNVAKHSAEAPELEFTSNADDIFTDTDNGSGKYGYRYRYGYRYGYKYGYSSYRSYYGDTGTK